MSCPQRPKCPRRRLNHARGAPGGEGLAVSRPLVQRGPGDPGCRGQSRPEPRTPRCSLRTWVHTHARQQAVPAKQPRGPGRVLRSGESGNFPGTRSEEGSPVGLHPRGCAPAQSLLGDLVLLPGPQNRDGGRAHRSGRQTGAVQPRAFCTPVVFFPTRPWGALGPSALPPAAAPEQRDRSSRPPAPHAILSLGLSSGPHTRSRCPPETPARGPTLAPRTASLRRSPSPEPSAPSAPTHQSL